MKLLIYSLDDIGCWYLLKWTLSYVPGGLEPPTFRLGAERANQLRHRDTFSVSVYLNFVSNYFEMNG